MQSPNEADKDSDWDKTKTSEQVKWVNLERFADFGRRHVEDEQKDEQTADHSIHFICRRNQEQNSL